MLSHWIWLAERPKISDRQKITLLNRFRDAEDLYFGDEAAIRDIEGLSEEAAASLADKDLTQANQILEECRRKRIRILTFRDAAYPNRLRNIPDPPLALYYKGNIPQFDALPTIAVVGTRRASAYGLSVAKRMGYQLAVRGALVVSGLASGIDAMAMSGALSGEGSAVGVLGCGADIVYPAANRELYADVERYGCLISEYPPGTQPNGWNFPRRNRIISGLSCGVLVVEAPEKSGALITARLAADQGRDVFAVPGNIDIPSCAGSNALLRDGATMVSSGEEILEEYEAVFPDALRRSPAEIPELLVAEPPAVLPENSPKKGEKNRPESNIKKNLEKKPIDKEPEPPYSDISAKMPALSAEEQQIVDALAGGERLVDDVVAQTGLTTGKLLAALTLLELKGLLHRLPGKRIVLTRKGTAAP